MTKLAHAYYHMGGHASKNIRSVRLHFCAGSQEQASNIYLLSQVEGLAAPHGADVDLRLGCSRLNILERISLALIYRPPGGWTAELAGG